MATWLEATNAVQKRLRETQTASVTTSTYSTLIGEFVNQAKREVEDAWNWSFLRQDITVTTANGTSQYTLTGTNKRSRMFEIRRAYDETNNSFLWQMTDHYHSTVVLTSTAQNGPPTYYRFRGLSSDAKQVDLYPIPNGVATIQFPMVVPQVDLAADGTEMTVPEHPVIMRAWALAVSERGEDGGSNYNEIDQMARNSLGDAIAQDVAQFDGETDWLN